eukprot:scaffold438244_cov19-Prasinocladus_malaysianus.AAC.1
MAALDLHTELFSCPLTVSKHALSYHSETPLAKNFSTEGPAFNYKWTTYTIAVPNTDAPSQLRA